MAAAAGHKPAPSYVPPVPRPRKKPETFKHVIKGRSYTEPLFGRLSVFNEPQEINGLVGLPTMIIGDIDYLKKNLGYVMASKEDTMSLQRFVLGLKEQGWIGQLKPQRKDQRIVLQIPEVCHVCEPETIEAAKIRKQSLISNPSHSLYPCQIKVARPQGECYSLMMRAKCHEKLFYADLERSKRLQQQTMFIRQQNLRHFERSKKRFDDLASQDELLLSNVRSYIQREIRKSITSKTPSDVATGRSA